MASYEGAAFPKQVRKRDKKLLAKIRQRPCLICFKRPVEVHHVRTRGAGGDDSESNCIPVCRAHHREFDRLGTESMFEKYQSLREWRKGLKK